MVRDEIQKDVEKMVDTDFRLQALYMTKKPKRLEVFTQETLKELASLQESTASGVTGQGTGGIRGANTSAGTYLWNTQIRGCAIQLNESRNLNQFLLLNRVQHGSFQDFFHGWWC